MPPQPDARAAHCFGSQLLLRSSVVHPWQLKTHLQQGAMDNTYASKGGDTYALSEHQLRALAAAQAAPPAPLVAAGPAKSSKPAQEDIGGGTAEAQPVSRLAKLSLQPPKAGTRLRAFWAEDGRWYTGAVGSPLTTKFTMLYDVTENDLLDAAGDVLRQQTVCVGQRPFSQPRADHSLLSAGRGDVAAGNQHSDGVPTPGCPLPAAARHPLQEGIQRAKEQQELHLRPGGVARRSGGAATPRGLGGARPATSPGDVSAQQRRCSVGVCCACSPGGQPRQAGGCAPGGCRHVTAERGGCAADQVVDGQRP